MSAEKVLGALAGFEAARANVFERGCQTTTGGREVYQWRPVDDSAAPWLLFAERYPAGPVHEFGREILSIGATLALDPQCSERIPGADALEG